MRPNIFIPEDIKAGFQGRGDTYTKRLAYVIYYDEKNTLRKEKSWNSWRDDKIEPEDHKNVPTEGFVLNKKAGGYSSGWNHRQTYVRVYDPRGFEFEITVPNLLYILENTNSIKGKGLEGEFVYGWEGTDLVLIPTSSPDYKEITEYNQIVHQNRKFKTADMIPGGTYLTKDNEEIIFIGKFPEYGYKGEKKRGNSFYFYDKGNYKRFSVVRSLNRVIGVVSEECVGNFAELREKVECITEFSPLDSSKDEYHSYTYEELVEEFDKRNWFNCYNSDHRGTRINKSHRGEEIYFVDYRHGWTRDSRRKQFNSLKEVFDYVKPMYKSEYLQNGKLYSEGKNK